MITGAYVEATDLITLPANSNNYLSPAVVTFNSSYFICERIFGNGQAYQDLSSFSIISLLTNENLMTTDLNFATLNANGGGFYREDGKPLFIFNPNESLKINVTNNNTQAINVQIFFEGYYVDNLGSRVQGTSLISDNIIDKYL